MKHISRFFLTSIGVLFFAFLLVPKQAYAMEFRNSDKAVVVAQGEVITGSLFAAGETVEIDGMVDGDVYCAGKSITVKGTVTGDLLCAGQTIQIDGTVSDSVRVAGQTIGFGGAVGKNVMAAGQTVDWTRDSSVGGDIITGGQNLTLNGTVHRSVLGAADTMTVGGVVGGDMNVAVQNLEIGNAARVTGAVTYQSDNDAGIARDAVVGSLVKKPMPKGEKGETPQEKLPKMWGAMQRPWPVSAVGSIITFFLLSVVFLFLFPGKTERVVTMVSAHPFQSLFIGIVSFVVTPIIFVTLLVTIIGIPLAILFILIFALMAFVSKLFVALWVGRKIQSSFLKKKGENWYWAAAIGVTISYLVFHIPVVGWLISGVAVFIGMGAMVGTMVSKTPLKKGRK